LLRLLLPLSDKVHSSFHIDTKMASTRSQVFTGSLNR